MGDFTLGEVLASMHIEAFKSGPETFVKIFLQRLANSGLYIVTAEELSRALCRYHNGPVTPESILRLLEQMVKDRKPSA